MRTRSFSVALLPWVTVLGCGGSDLPIGEGDTGGRPGPGTGGVDVGAPGGRYTGGGPTTWYGPISTGGTGGIDVGAPGGRYTGGGPATWYGPIPTGGTGGIAIAPMYGPMPTGGTGGIDSGVPDASTQGGTAVVVPMYGPPTPTGGSR